MRQNVEPSLKVMKPLLVGRKVRVCALVLACVPAWCAIGATFDEPPKGKPTKDASAEAGREPAKESRADLLRDATDAWRKVQAMSYVGLVSSSEDAKGGDSAKAGESTVIAQRAEAGGWKIFIRASEEGTVSEAGYDGVTARAVRPKDKTVVERTAETLTDVRVFFAGQGVRYMVAWDVLEESPFASSTGVVAGSPAVQVVEGLQCDVVEVTLNEEKRETVTPNDHEKPMDADKAKTPGAVTRVWIAREDKLPRKIEQVRTVAGKASTRTLVLRDFKVNAEATGSDFAVNIPDGFRVKAADRLANKPGTGRTKPKVKGEEDGTGDEAGGDSGKATDKGGGKDTGKAGDKFAWKTDADLLAPGAKAPSFKLKDGHGKTKSLKDYEGKVVVLDFWATWCGPCRAAMPALQAIHEKYKDQSVVVIGMNAEGGTGPGQKPADILKFKEDKGCTYECLMEADSVSEKYKVTGLPTFYVINPSGEVVWGGVGLAGPPGNTAPSTADRTKFLERTIGAYVEAELEKLKGK